MIVFFFLSLLMKIVYVHFDGENGGKIETKSLSVIDVWVLMLDNFINANFVVFFSFWGSASEVFSINIFRFFFRKFPRFKTSKRLAVFFFVVQNASCWLWNELKRCPADSLQLFAIIKKVLIVRMGMQKGNSRLIKRSRNGLQCISLFTLLGSRQNVLLIRTQSL